MADFRHSPTVKSVRNAPGAPVLPSHLHLVPEYRNIYHMRGVSEFEAPVRMSVTRGPGTSTLHLVPRISEQYYIGEFGSFELAQGPAAHRAPGTGLIHMLSTKYLYYGGVWEFAWTTVHRSRSSSRPSYIPVTASRVFWDNSWALAPSNSLTLLVPRSLTKMNTGAP